MRSVFDVAEGVKCRVCHQDFTNSYEPLSTSSRTLSTSSQTLQDAGLYSGEVGVA